MLLYRNHTQTMFNLLILLQKISKIMKPYEGVMMGHHFMDQRSMVQTEELIDISSDENEAGNSEKPTNGPLLAKSKHPLLQENNTNKHPLLKNSPAMPERPASASSTKKRKITNNVTSVAKKMKSEMSEPAAITFDDVAGMHQILRQISEMMMSIRNPAVWTENGVNPPKGFLLHGPPGCGKTLLVNAIAGVSTL